MTEVDLTYPHQYVVKEFPELPGSGWGDIPVHFFPRTTTRPEHDGIWLLVSPNSGTSWVGVFDFGYDVPPAVSKVFSTPNPNRLCVVSAGAAYLVVAHEPENWELLELFPVTGVRAIPECGMLIIATFHKLAALGPEGIAWESPRLCWDDLRIAKADSERIEGVGYDPTNPSTEMPFSVETRTGRSLLPAPLSINGEHLW
jgi:hypothetical protein